MAARPPQPPHLPPAQLPPLLKAAGVVPAADLLVAAGRERITVAGGFLAGLCVFFAPLAVIALGLLGAYLAYTISDGDVPVLRVSHPLAAEDFRAVFAPAVNEAPLLVACGAAGAVLALFRRRLWQRLDPALLLAGRRPFFPELALLYAIAVALTLAMAATHGGVPQVRRLLVAAPLYLPFLVCVCWLAHAVWQYCLRNWVDLLATEADRTAAGELRARARLARTTR